MTEISAWNIYWVMQADNILWVLAGVSVLSLTSAAFLFICWREEIDNSRTFNRSKTTRYDNLLLLLTMMFSLLTVISLGAVMFIPNTKTLASMYAIPAIANNENVQKEAKELYDIAKDALKQIGED